MLTKFNACCPQTVFYYPYLGASEEFQVNIGLRQGSVLSPLLFVAALNLISRKTVVKDTMKKLLYVDDLAVVANGKHEIQETWRSGTGCLPETD